MYAIARTRNVRRPNGIVKVLSAVETGFPTTAAATARIAVMFPNLSDRNKASLSVVHAGTIAASARLAAKQGVKVRT